VLHTGWIQASASAACITAGNSTAPGNARAAGLKATRASPISGSRVIRSPEYAGAIFAYMGEGPAPDFQLLRKDVFERPGGLMFTREEVWPCNWFQLVENSLDATMSASSTIGARSGTFGQHVAATIPTLDYLETDAGIRQIATRSKNSVRVSDWTFPTRTTSSCPA
jgi:5,5'-dehydrodivanillate O-demethylase